MALRARSILRNQIRQAAFDAFSEALSRMQYLQERSNNPADYVYILTEVSEVFADGFSDDLARIVDEFVREANVRGEFFDVQSQSIVTVGSQTTQTGPQAPTPLRVKTVEIGDMN